MTDLFIVGFQPNPFNNLEKRLLEGQYSSRDLSDGYVTGAIDRIDREDIEGTFSDTALTIYPKTEDGLAFLAEYQQALIQENGPVKDKASFLQTLAYVTSTSITLGNETYPSLLSAQDHFETKFIYEFGNDQMYASYDVMNYCDPAIIEEFRTMDGAVMDPGRLPRENFGLIAYKNRTNDLIQTKLTYFSPLAELMYSP